MNKFIKVLLAGMVCGLYLASCASTPPVEGLLSLDEALDEIVASVEARVLPGAEVSVAKVDAPLPELADFLYDELLDLLNAGGSLTALARGVDMKILDIEQQFQMMGMVNDTSAVSIGKYLGAKVMITVSFTRYASFSQLSSRALDVETGAVIATSRSRIRNSDPLLASVAAPLQKTKVAAITTDALKHLNLGKDYYAEDNNDAAIDEFNKALAINKELSEAWYYRGLIYSYFGEDDRAIADLTQAIKLDPNYVAAYCERGYMYYSKSDYDRAIADYTQAIRLDPNGADSYISRGAVYRQKEDYDQAIADFTQAIRLNPNFSYPYYERGLIYHYSKRDYDRAIADYTQAIRLGWNYASGYYGRGTIYFEKKDYDRAIADFTQAIRLDPDFDAAYNDRGSAYHNGKKDYDRAIADFEAALRIDPNNTTARNNLEIARRLRGY
jgi:tetratricopeptide (TPR) repeat protein